MNAKALQSLLPTPSREVFLPEGASMPLCYPLEPDASLSWAPPHLSGKTILRKQFFFLKRGLVGIQRGRPPGETLIKYYVKAEQFFGELALVSGEAACDLAAAVRASEIYVYDALQARRIMINHPPFSVHIWKLLAHRLHLIRQHMRPVVQACLKDRLMVCLTDYVRNLSDAAQEPYAAENFLTYHDLAYLTRASVSEVEAGVRTLEAQGKIRYGEDTIYLLKL